MASFEVDGGGIAISKYEQDLFDVVDVSAAADADAAEHKQTIRDAWHRNRKAIFWSMALSWALIMEGYDVVVVSCFVCFYHWIDWLMVRLIIQIGSYYGQTAFCQRFGLYSTSERE
jgi:hypothetical protein